MAERKFSVGVVGSGSRAQVICRNLEGLGTLDYSVDRIYDENPDAARAFREKLGHAGTKICTSFLEVVDGSPDAVIIASINCSHLEPALACFQRRIPLYLEKPLAATWEDTVELARGWRETKTPVVVGFVLRYTAFYRKVKELCASGALGEIVSIHADENFGPTLVSLFLRGWRRFRSQAGPIILEKCCHDIDMLNWLAASKPVRVSSLGTRSAFLPRPDLPQRCRDCAVYDTCVYHYLYPEEDRIHRDDGATEYSENLEDLCVWNCEKDISDHQTALIEYENGAIASLSLNMSAEQTRRTIRIFGTKGRIEGDLHESTLVEYPLDGTGSGTGPINHPVQADNESGHHGGDQSIAEELEKILANPKEYSPAASVEEGYLGALVAFAADRSLQERRTVECSELLET